MENINNMNRIESTTKKLEIMFKLTDGLAKKFISLDDDGDLSGDAEKMLEAIDRLGSTIADYYGGIITSEIVNDIEL